MPVAAPALVVCDGAASALDKIAAEAVLKLPGRRQKEPGIPDPSITHDIATPEAIRGEAPRGVGVVERGPGDDVPTPPQLDRTEPPLSPAPGIDPDPPRRAPPPRTCP